MKIIEAIQKIDGLKFNTFDQDLKVGWLSELDSKVKTQVIDAHEGGENVAFAGYDGDTDMHTQLLIGPPFESVYLRWMEAQIDYWNGEIDKYNISITMFNTEFEAYENWYNRTHMPKANAQRFIF